MDSHRFDEFHEDIAQVKTSIHPFEVTVVCSSQLLGQDEKRSLSNLIATSISLQLDSNE
jgi:hypothetical protein